MAAIILTMSLMSMLLAVIRVVKGPTIYDRILGANIFGTKTVITILLIALLSGQNMLIDIAMVYVMLNFITTLGILKYRVARSFKSNQLIAEDSKSL